MFGHQTMFDDVWSPNIYRLDRPLVLTKRDVGKKKSSGTMSFHSRTKASAYIRKEFNHQRIGLVHQHDGFFIVLEHQYGCLDVM